MYFLSFISLVAMLVLGSASVYASPLHDLVGVEHMMYGSKTQNDTNLRYVANSGICETTPGVTQYSGYIDVGTNMSMWFWFFEARNSPETAPFTLWLNGGPGCSSMIGLFQENGPCLVKEDNTTYLNPYSWNNVSNMIYIDQPIGAGFSYGTEIVNSTETAATFVWKAFQILFESQLFSGYASREFILATESFGGHYGPGFVTYFDEQNALIASGSLKGEPITVSALMINNGWFDPLIQDIAYYTFACNASGYGQLTPNAALKNVSEGLYGSNGCIAQEQACYAAGNRTDEANKICEGADDYCINNVYLPALGERNPYDLRQNRSDPNPFPPDYYADYLSLPEVVKAIGAETTFQECGSDPYALFSTTGDRARSLLPQLSELVNSRLKVLIWAGDTDFICNWIGDYNAVLAMSWYGNETFHSTPLTNITLDDKPIAAVANVDNFSFARVYGAGHEVPAFQPAAAFVIFNQTIHNEPLHSVSGPGLMPMMDLHSSDTR